MNKPCENKKESSERNVYYSNSETFCSECKAHIEKSEKIYLCGDNEVLCLSCADLDHLVYLPSGNTALSTRARKYSSTSEIVWSYSKARKRNERQGILVTEEALEKAEQVCLGDAEIRERKRVKAAAVSELKDSNYISKFAAKISEMFPGCPNCDEIANHACEKYSMRVGRSASAKEFNPQDIILAVRAHIRHRHTNYDSLLAENNERQDARELVSGAIESVLEEWMKP